MIFDFSFEFKDIEEEEEIELSCLTNADETYALFIEFSQDLFWEWWEVTEIDYSYILYKLSRW